MRALEWKIGDDLQRRSKTNYRNTTVLGHVKNWSGKVCRLADVRSSVAVTVVVLYRAKASAAPTAWLRAVSKRRGKRSGTTCSDA